MKSGDNLFISIAPNGWHYEHDVMMVIDDDDYGLLILPWLRLGGLPVKLPQLLLTLDTTDTSNCHNCCFHLLQLLLPLAKSCSQLPHHNCCSHTPKTRSITVWNISDNEAKNWVIPSKAGWGSAHFWQVTFDLGHPNDLIWNNCRSHVNWMNWNEL